MLHHVALSLLKHMWDIYIFKFLPTIILVLFYAAKLMLWLMQVTDGILYMKIMYPCCNKFTWLVKTEQWYCNRCGLNITWFYSNPQSMPIVASDLGYCWLTGMKPSVGFFCCNSSTFRFDKSCVLRCFSAHHGVKSPHLSCRKLPNQSILWYLSSTRISWLLPGCFFVFRTIFHTILCSKL